LITPSKVNRLEMLVFPHFREGLQTTAKAMALTFSAEEDIH